MGILETKQELENAVNEYNFCLKKTQELMPIIHRLTGKLEAYQEIEAEAEKSKKEKPAKPIEKEPGKEKTA